MNRIVALDDPAARDSRTVGDKAARLAQAIAVGLPVLPGWVLPISEGAAAASVGNEARERSGASAAYLAVADLKLEEALGEELQLLVKTLGKRVVVRSSTRQDADGRWAGAFASYLDIGPDELPVAVRGCWASAFSRDARGRAEAVGVDADEMGVAILIQPMLNLDGGGTATVGPDGRVVVTGVTGSPAGLMRGRRTGSRAEVLTDGSAVGTNEGDGLGQAALVKAATLARQVAEATGDDAIEWGIHRGRLVLLQAHLGAAPAPAQASGQVPRPAPRGAVRLARLAVRYPAPLGEMLVLSWALGQPHLPDATPVPLVNPASALDEVRCLAAELRGAAWGATPNAGARSSEEAIRRLLSGDPHEAITELGAVQPVDNTRARRLLGLAAGLGEKLAANGLLPHPQQAWRLTAEELTRAVHRGERPPLRQGPDRWEPLVFEIARSAGRECRGVSAASGIGAGRLRFIGGASGWAPPAPRQVLATPAPLPQIAPLLWGAAAVVTGTGSPGAHLFEVARSLGVPAVSGVDLNPSDLGDDVLAAVDGAAGSIWILPGDKHER